MSPAASNRQTSKAPAPSPLLRVLHLAQRYPMPGAFPWVPGDSIEALSGVSFDLQAGKSLGVVGESGSGKSTLARLIMALERPAGGAIYFQGADLHRLSPAALKKARAGFQMVFQDPYSSLDPRQKVLDILSEPLLAQAQTTQAQRAGLAQEALEEVGLRSQDVEKYPHEFSGGQRQRIAIARALITRPALIVADEPVSALDVSVQAQVLNLMMDLQDRHNLSYVFISHDLSVIKLVADDVLVLQSGRAVEQGPCAQVLDCPQHPYTQKLLSAVPQAAR